MAVDVSAHVPDPMRAQTDDGRSWCIVCGVPMPCPVLQEAATN